MKEKFYKSLAKYYQKWMEDSLESVKYCEERGMTQAAADYAKSAENCKKIIEENKEAIEFFSVGDRAFLIDSALPEKFRGYE